MKDEELKHGTATAVDGIAAAARNSMGFMTWAAGMGWEMVVWPKIYMTTHPALVCDRLIALSFLLIIIISGARPKGPFCFSPRARKYRVSRVPEGQKGKHGLGAGGRGTLDEH